MAKCSHKGCESAGDAIWTPRLLLRKQASDAPLGATLVNWPVCDWHKDGADLEDYLCDEGWTKIHKYLRECGKGRFTKNLTELQFVPNTKGSDEWLPF
jgi:hypothetical protein